VALLSDSDERAPRPFILTGICPRLKTPDMEQHRRPSNRAVLLGIAAAYAAPAIAHAHTGLGAGRGFFAGVGHPVAGLDHLCAIIAVGLWAAQRGGKALWLLPLAFVAVMAVGGALGVAGVPLPLVEPGIAASVLVLGLLVATAAHVPLAVSVILVGVFALVHGHAHGTEMPATATGLAYGLGFIGATAALNLSGVALALGFHRIGSTHAVRIAGGAVATCGLYLCLV
jgi:urease accessory protein